jgi:hypothetical protein
VLQNKGLGKVSYRGIAALGIGLLFIWFALNPQHFNDDTPPFFVLVIMFVAGVRLAYGGIVSLRFVWKRSYLVRSNASVAAEICVLEDHDSDRGTETVHVRINSRCQALGVDRSAVAHRYVDGKVRWGKAWLDEKGNVLALAISGEHFNTLIGGREIPADCFGEKE